MQDDPFTIPANDTCRRVTLLSMTPSGTPPAPSSHAPQYASEDDELDLELVDWLDVDEDDREDVDDDDDDCSSQQSSLHFIRKDMPNRTPTG